MGLWIAAVDSTTPVAQDCRELHMLHCCYCPTCRTRAFIEASLLLLRTGSCENQYLLAFGDVLRSFEHETASTLVLAKVQFDMSTVSVLSIMMASIVLVRLFVLFSSQLNFPDIPAFLPLLTTIYVGGAGAQKKYLKTAQVISRFFKYPR